MIDRTGLAEFLRRRRESLQPEDVGLPRGRRRRTSGLRRGGGAPPLPPSGRYYSPPPRGAVREHITPGLLPFSARLQDTPAEIVTEVGETLRQTAPGVALTGD